MKIRICNIPLKSLSENMKDNEVFKHKNNKQERE